MYIKSQDLCAFATIYSCCVDNFFMLKFRAYYCYSYTFLFGVHFALTWAHFGGKVEWTLTIASYAKFPQIERIPKALLTKLCTYDIEHIMNWNQNLL